MAYLDIVSTTCAFQAHSEDRIAVIEEKERTVKMFAHNVAEHRQLSSAIGTITSMASSKRLSGKKTPSMSAWDT